MSLITDFEGIATREDLLQYLQENTGKNPVYQEVLDKYLYE